VSKNVCHGVYEKEILVVKNTGIIYNRQQSTRGLTRMDDSAELFEAIAHPTRIKILKILEKEPSTFASLKRQLDLDSSGNLDHHLKKLGSLIIMQSDGFYGLTEAGKKALASVGAVEEWKESERLRLKRFTRKPMEVSLLAVLTLIAGVVAAVVTAQVIYSDTLNVPFLPAIYLIAAALGFLSFAGLFIGKGWGWTLAVVQAALVMAYVLVPLYFDLYVSETSTEGSNLFAGFTSVFLLANELGVLLIAMRRPAKEFFRKQDATPLRRRALAGGVLGILSGLIELFIGCLASFAPASSMGGGGTYVFSLFFFVAGLLVAMGGVAIFLRQYTLGGVLILAFSLFPLPYYNIVAVFFSVVTWVPVFPVNLLFVAALIAMPFAAVILAFLSRPKTRE
jgi:DNA-binding transcriptional ArsR family regulator